MRRSRGPLLALAIPVILCMPRPSAAQDRPFVFSITTATETAKPTMVIGYDVAAGEAAFRSNDTANGPEQRFVAQASLGRWTLVGHVGLAASDSRVESSQQGEVLYSFLRQGTAPFTLAAGGGVLHEAGGVDVVLARVAAGRDFDAWRLQGNMVFQKPLSSQRDGMDVITTFGCARRLTPALSFGIEAIGEDLEGFWEPQEAEGGARLLVGPSLHIAPRGKKWQLSVAGGPSFHPRDTARSSDALRDLPATRNRLSYAVRTGFAYAF